MIQKKKSLSGLPAAFDPEKEITSRSGAELQGGIPALKYCKESGFRGK